MVEQFQAFLLLPEGLPDVLAVPFQQYKPLLLARSRPDQPGVASL